MNNRKEPSSRSKPAYPPIRSPLLNPSRVKTPHPESLIPDFAITRLQPSGTRLALVEAGHVSGSSQVLLSAETSKKIAEKTEQRLILHLWRGFVL